MRAEASHWPRFVSALCTGRSWTRYGETAGLDRAQHQRRLVAAYVVLGPALDPGYALDHLPLVLAIDRKGVAIATDAAAMGHSADALGLGGHRTHSARVRHSQPATSSSPGPTPSSAACRRLGCAGSVRRYVHRADRPAWGPCKDMMTFRPARTHRLDPRSRGRGESWSVGSSARCPTSSSPTSRARCRLEPDRFRRH